MTPAPCPFCGGTLWPEGDGFEHPDTQACPLDNLWFEARHIPAWNARPHHLPDTGKKVGGA